MIINKYTGIFFFIAALTSILLLSLVPSYFYHLRVDIYGQYINHVKLFLSEKSLEHLGYNEYQPVAVMFFIALSPFYTFFNDDINSYIYGLYLINILLAISAAFLIYAIKKNYTNIFIFGLILFFTGPIILNRFELLVFNILLLSVLFFIKKGYFSSGIFIAIAIFTKIYPVIFVPYMFYLAVKNKRKGHYDVIRFILGGIFGAALVLFVFCNLLGADFNKIITDAQIHSLKPVHAESTWATLVTLINWNGTGNHFIGRGAVGIYGIKEESILMPKWFYNYLWILFIAVYYIFLALRSHARKNLEFEPGIIYTLAVLFLVTSKILTGQYLLWFSLLFTLITVPVIRKKQAWWSAELLLILLTASLTQFIYPLNYDGFVRFYENSSSDSFYFWVLTARNIMLIILLIISWNHFKIERKKILYFHK